MTSYSITADLVRKALKDTPLPASIDDLDEVSRRRIEERAFTEGTTPASLYEVIKTAQAEELKASADAEFDAEAIARAVRGTGPFSGPTT